MSNEELENELTELKRSLKVTRFTTTVMLICYIFTMLLFNYRFNLLTTLYYQIIGTIAQ